jgi:hypothetical protein
VISRIVDSSVTAAAARCSTRPCGLSTARDREAPTGASVKVCEVIVVSQLRASAPLTSRISN